MSASIHDEPLADQSGRNARRGFEYQDHVGARYCLRMLINPALLEVWFESHDDITLKWDIGGGAIGYEFTQVKFYNSPLTFATVKNREGGKPSLLEKSLAHDKYNEPATFRLITAFNPCSELAGLRFLLGTPERVQAVAALQSALAEIQQYYSKLLNPPTEQALAHWINNCVWETGESTLSGVEAVNLIELEQVLKQFGFTLYPEHRLTLYDLLLRKVADASIKDPYADRDVFKIKKQDCINWLRDKAASVGQAPDPKDKLGSKLREIGIPNSGIELARETRLLYNAERRDNDFCEQKDLRAMEAIILGKVSSLQRKQLNPRTEQPPLDFYEACLNEATSILTQQRFIDEDGVFKIPDSLAEGYVYEIVERCALRFKNLS